jgi:hypothetical protein
MSEDGSRSRSIIGEKYHERELESHKLFVTNLDGTVKV